MNPLCPNCRADGTDVVKFGTYFRRCDSRRIQRFLCRACLKHFSRATHSRCYRQRKRRINHRMKLLFMSSVSKRQIARILGVARNTVDRRLLFFAQQAQDNQRKHLAAIAPAKSVQFDDLITIEHTKLKPLSVSVVVDSARWKILGLSVAQIPSSGPLAKISRKKYGKRPDHSRRVRKELFRKIANFIDDQAHFVTDEHRDYAPLVKATFPQATHRQYKGKRGSVYAQGELKKTGFDPLFCINHVLAMLRAHLSRLVRRTWAATKKPECLLCHLQMFVDYYNTMRSPRLKTPMTEYMVS